MQAYSKQKTPCYKEVFIYWIPAFAGMVTGDGYNTLENICVNLR